MQGSGACWPGLQGLGAEMLERRREPCLSCDCKAPPSETIQCPPGKPLKNYNFRKPRGGSLAKAWVSAETDASEVGTWRETKPGYPPLLPPPHPTFWGCKGERKRVFTLSAFGNHPTRPPRSADSHQNGL